MTEFARTCHCSCQDDMMKSKREYDDPPRTILYLHLFNSTYQENGCLIPETLPSSTSNDSVSSDSVFRFQFSDFN